MCSPEDIVVLRFLVTGKVFQCISRTDGLGPEILECENQQIADRLSAASFDASKERGVNTENTQETTDRREKR
ncbi:unnamed protein product [Hermetia illucens]|uniref:Uncharacterized protein n=1 Tax=Hermetia illucens TaxID=343691 RepID=A0A7R8UH54_HERIL|nr:unnamed protein product [Hermetia illucens]